MHYITKCPTDTWVCITRIRIVQLQLFHPNWATKCCLYLLCHSINTMVALTVSHVLDNSNEILCKESCLCEPIHKICIIYFLEKFPLYSILQLLHCGMRKQIPTLVTEQCCKLRWTFILPHWQQLALHFTVATLTVDHS